VSCFTIFFTTKTRAEQINFDQNYTRWDLLDELPVCVPVRTSIGCPYRCNYCDFWCLYPNIFLRSKESLQSELSLITKKRDKKLTMIEVVDGNVFINPRRVDDVCKAFIDAEVREVTKTNTPILLVFLSVFCVATMHEYYNMRPLSRLEYEQKFCVIRVYYFLRIP
jgi:hypothetical protein